MNCRPQIGVIYPLIDVRGRAADRVRRWTQGQSLEAGRYRVIVVSAGEDPSQDREAEQVLRPGDELMVMPGGRDADLWNAGAARSATPWLVFTEGHCDADSGCLAAVSRWITANPDRVIGNCEIVHDDSYLGARLANRWFKSMEARWQTPDAWPRLHRSGFAIRTEAFLNAGGFEAQYGQFAVPLLSARLHAAGLEFDGIPGARLLHWDDERIRDHHVDTADFVRGEFAARSRNDLVFFERYFGDCPAWRNQLRMERKTAGHVLRALRAAAAACPGKSAAILGLMWPWALAALVGVAPRIALGRLRLKWNEFVIERVALREQWRYSCFVSAHARAVRLARLECIPLGANPLRAAAAGRWPIERLDPAALIGVHALERHANRPLRWTEPVFLLRGLPAEGECEIRIRTGAIRGDPLSCVIAAVVGNRVLPRALLTSDAAGTLSVRLSSAWVPTARDGIVLIVSPLIPSRGASSDPRRLGLPMLSIECVPLHGEAPVPSETGLHII